MDKFMKKYGITSLVTLAIIVGLILAAKKFPTVPGLNFVSSVFGG